MLKSIMEFFATGNASDGYSLKATGYLTLIAIILILLAIVFLSKRESKKMQTKQLVFCSVSIALAVVTSFITFAHLPFGGSVTLFSMLFICLIGYFYGTKVGILAGIAYGCLQLIINPLVYYPVQALLDYPVAFGLLGLSGVFRNKNNGLIKGYLLGVFGRYIAHFLSGYIFFASYTPKGRTPIGYALTYNATYIVPEAVATIIILAIPAIANAIKEVKKMANEA